MAGTALTLTEAAEALGISVKAVRSRVERGSLPATLGPDGLRRVPASIVEEIKETSTATTSQRYPEVPPTSQGASPELFETLLARLSALESAVAENSKLLQLTERVEDEKKQLELKVFELSACVTTLEAQLANNSRWWRRKKTAKVELTTSESVPDA